MLCRPCGYVAFRFLAYLCFSMGRTGDSKWQVRLAKWINHLRSQATCKHLLCLMVGNHWVAYARNFRAAWRPRPFSVANHVDTTFSGKTFASLLLLYSKTGKKKKMFFRCPRAKLQGAKPVNKKKVLKVYSKPAKHNWKKNKLME